MNFTYPYEIEREREHMLVVFPDVPEAHTQIDPGDEFGKELRDCLVTALGAYTELRRKPPRPSLPKGRPVVALDVLMSAKLALSSAMIDAGLSNSDLARQLGVSEKLIRRLLDLDHSSRIDRLEAVLNRLGHRLEVSIKAVPPAPFRGTAPLA